jgi:hypothetical protein
MLRANIIFPPFFRMANPERPLSLATVIWFGSLEFMSLGYDYDMVLFPPRHPTDHDHELSQPRGAVHRDRRSRRARTARRRHAQHSKHHRLIGDDGVPRFDAPQLSSDMESLCEDLCRMSLAMGKMPIGRPATPSSGAAPPPPGLGSASPVAGAMPPSTFPYGLYMAA